MQNENPGPDNRTAEQLFRSAAKALTDSKPAEAFALLNRAKALKTPVQGVDFLRATILSRANQPMAAREVLLEELRYFPGNGEARDLLARLEATVPSLIEPTIADEEFRSLYQVIRPYTMLGEQRLYSLHTLARKVCEQQIPGNFVECGVAAGGASALLATVIKEHSSVPRRLFACDTFEGMPAPTEQDQGRGVAADQTGWGTGTCAAPVGSLDEICSTLGVSHLVTAVPGDFRDTLPSRAERIGPIALLHLDSDWYASTRTALDHLYDRIIDGGLVQLDDYHFWEGVGLAVHEFERERGLSFKINEIDGTGVWFGKP